MPDVLRVLFVGAPFGAFCAHLAQEIERDGIEVWRAVFDGGDFASTRAKNRLVFKGEESEWPRFAYEFMLGNRIDAVIVFNDELPRNAAALNAAKRLGISRYILENGYLRPFWVTLEANGVNGNSEMPRDIDYYIERNCPAVEHREFSFRLRDHVLNTVKHYCFTLALSPFLPFNSRYYGAGIWKQARGYVREYAWRVTHSETEKLDAIEALQAAGKKVFVCLLQKSGDKQLVAHSTFGNNKALLQTVLPSFHAQAPDDAVLVIKQHPLEFNVDKALHYAEDYIRDNNLADRVFYLRKTSIEKTLDVAAGVITINSTGGLAALQRGLPVICLGNAFYDMAGLTNQCGIDSFWAAPEKPNMDGAEAFLNYLKATSQLNGGFHSRQAREVLIGNFVTFLRAHLERRPAANLATFSTAPKGKASSDAIPVPQTLVVTPS